MDRVKTLFRRVGAIRLLPAFSAIVALNELWGETTREMAMRPPWVGWTLLLQFIEQELRRYYRQDIEAKHGWRVKKEEADRALVFEDWDIPNEFNPYLVPPAPSERPEAELQTLFTAQEALDTTRAPLCPYVTYQGFCNVGTCIIHFPPPEPQQQPPPPPPAAPPSPPRFPPLPATPRQATPSPPPPSPNPMPNGAPF